MGGERRDNGIFSTTEDPHVVAWNLTKWEQNKRGNGTVDFIEALKNHDGVTFLSTDRLNADRVNGKWLEETTGLLKQAPRSKAKDGQFVQQIVPSVLRFSKATRFEFAATHCRPDKVKKKELSEYTAEEETTTVQSFAKKMHAIGYTKRPGSKCVNRNDGGDTIIEMVMTVRAWNWFARKSSTNGPGPRKLTVFLNEDVPDYHVYVDRNLLLDFITGEILPSRVPIG